MTPAGRWLQMRSCHRGPWKAGSHQGPATRRRNQPITGLAASSRLMASEIMALNHQSHRHQSGSSMIEQVSGNHIAHVDILLMIVKILGAHLRPPVRRQILQYQTLLHLASVLSVTGEPETPQGDQCHARCRSSRGHVPDATTDGNNPSMTITEALLQAGHHLPSDGRPSAC